MVLVLWTQFLILCVALPVTQANPVSVWEFGLDAPGSIVVDELKGHFSFFEKTKEIPLAVPECYVVEYVRVQVENLYSKPEVEHIASRNLVTISYKPLQYSVSNYDIVAKAARSPGCYNQEVEMKRRIKMDT